MTEDAKLSSEQRDQAARIKRTISSAKDLVENSEVTRRNKALQAVRPVAAILDILSEKYPDCSADALLAAALELSAREQP